MKKFVSLVMLLCTCLSMFSFPVNSDENENSSNNIIYLSSTEVGTYDRNANNTSVTAKELNSIEGPEVLASPYIIVDFEVMNEEVEVLSYISELIKVGKIIFIRADSHTANVSMIKYLLNGFSANGDKIYESSPTALMERINTFGYVVYLDCNQQLQVVRQSADYVTLTASELSADVELTNISKYVVDQAENVNTIMSNERAYALLNSRRTNFNEQVDAVNDFLSYNSPTDVHSFTNQLYEMNAQAFDVGSNYEKVYDTVTCYSDGKAVGSITRRICASRLSPETTNKTGAPFPIATGETKWVFQSVINMSPKWSSDKFFNTDLYTSFTTYPVGTSNATYKNVIMDYQPKTDTSGKTDVTYSIGRTYSIGQTGSTDGISGGVSWVKSYKDINFTVDFASGSKTTTNNAAWHYTIGYGSKTNGKLWLQKNVQKSTVELISAVRVDNMGNKTIGVQLNTQPTWGKMTGIFKGTIYTPAMSSVVYILPVR